MRSELGLEIRFSTIKDAGRGLFTLWRRAPGEFIVEYEGQILDKNELDRRYSTSNFLAVYSLEVNANCFIDSACWRSIGAYANGSCKGTRPNARFIVNQRSCSARIVATKVIPANGEIFVSYGRSYWNGASKVSHSTDDDPSEWLCPVASSPPVLTVPSREGRTLLEGERESIGETSVLSPRVSSLSSPFPSPASPLVIGR